MWRGITLTILEPLNRHSRQRLIRLLHSQESQRKKAKEGGLDLVVARPGFFLVLPEPGVGFEKILQYLVEITSLKAYNAVISILSTFVETRRNILLLFSVYA